MRALAHCRCSGHPATGSVAKCRAPGLTPARGRWRLVNGALFVRVLVQRGALYREQEVPEVPGHPLDGLEPLNRYGFY